MFDLTRIGSGLPVAAEASRAALQTALTSGSRLVVQAPPGTGKTTFVPALAANLTSDRVLVTQPRRIATRAAAHRLAALSGTPVGADVGYRVRGESRSGPSTKVEFCTTGVLLRRLLAEPDLPGISTVILDEVHERQLDSDLVLGMVREVAELRGDLTVVAMSATLAADRFARLLGDGKPAAVVQVDGALHPLTVEWAPPVGVPALDARGITDGFLAHVARTTRDALTRWPGDALVFVPGVREVARVADLLAGAARVVPLHGQLSAAEQQEALTPSSERRVIVATAVAESSLTVPGVRIVVDSGLAREPRYDATRGMSGLVTRTGSRASAEQRAGRAAREAPGVVVRCFAAETWARLAPEPTPEILTADLTRAVLDLACWGTPRGEGLALPDAPPVTAVERAEQTLRDLAAIDATGAVTPTGQRLARVPVDPRLARGLFVGAGEIGAQPAAEIVAALESDARAPGADGSALVRSLRAGQHPATGRWRAEAKRLARLVGREVGGPAREKSPTAGRVQQGGALSDVGFVGDRRIDAGANGRTGGRVGRPSSRASAAEATGLVVAAAFPDRIARRRGGDSRAYLLASGTAADLPPDSALGQPEWLAIAELDRTARVERPGVPRGSGAVIRAAAVLTEEQALAAGEHLVSDEEQVEWSGGRLSARRVRRLGAIELGITNIPVPRDAGAAAVRTALARDGLELLEWSPAANVLRRRLAYAHTHLGSPWPAVDSPTLIERLDEWLGPELVQLADGASVRSLDLTSALRRLLPWPEAGAFDELVPERLTVPTGSAIRVDYPEDPADRPVLAVKLQECFGLTETPRIAGVPILFHLLSPAGRPLAVTDDLASFWVNGYPGVRAENRGRYAKHPWPEDPLTAKAQRGTTKSGR